MLFLWRALNSLIILLCFSKFVCPITVGSSSHELKYTNKDECEGWYHSDASKFGLSNGDQNISSKVNKKSFEGMKYGTPCDSISNKARLDHAYVRV